MDTSLKTLERYGLDKLPFDELILIRESVDNLLVDDSPSEFSEEFKADLDGREADADANDGWIPVVDVFQRLRQSVKRDIHN